MKKVLIVLLLSVLYSCSNDTVQNIPTKFTIISIDSSKYISKDMAYYSSRAVNGEEFGFYVNFIDINGKFKVGDQITFQKVEE